MVYHHSTADNYKVQLNTNILLSITVQTTAHFRCTQLLHNKLVLGEINNRNFRNGGF